MIENSERCLHEVVACQRIRSTIEVYFNGFDSRNEAVILDCFTPDATAIYHFGTQNELTLVGRNAMADYFRRTLGVFSSSWHSTSNFRMCEFSGDTANTDTFAIANLVIGRRMVVRGIRYIDSHVSSAGDWRIKKRTHNALWQYEADLVDPIAPGKT